MLFRRKNPTYTITIPCESSDVDSIIYLASQLFGEATIIGTTVHDAYRKNPYCGIVAKDARDNVVGYMDFFLLKPETFDAFLAGNTSEEHFVSDDILPYGSPDARNRVYLGGIAAFSDSSHERGKTVQMLLHACAKLMETKYIQTTSPIDAYATGYSREGIVLLERLGFRCVDDGKERKDQQPLYHCEFTPDWIEQLARRYAAAERNYQLKIRT